MQLLAQGWLVQTPPTPDDHFGDILGGKIDLPNKYPAEQNLPNLEQIDFIHNRHGSIFFRILTGPYFFFLFNLLI